MDILMMFMGMTALKRQGFFRQNGTLKNILLWSAYFILRLCGFRFGTAEFINDLLYHLGVIFVCVILLHIMERPTHIIEVEKPIIIPIEEKPVLDLSQFTTFTDRDKEWIKRVMDGEKFQSIANDYKVTLGTVKNRMKLLYREMHITDRVTLLAQYGGQ